MSDWSQLDLKGRNHSDSRLRDVDLRGTEFLDCNLGGVLLKNVNLQGSTLDDVNLKGVDFENVALTGATFRNACFGNVSIADANLTGMTIEGIPVEELLRVYRERRGTDGPAGSPAT